MSDVVMSIVRRVLLVDTDEQMVGAYRAVLDPIPRVSTIGVARDGATALTMIDRLRPDLVLLDVDLPVRNGFEVLRCCAEPDRHQPDIIVISANSGGHEVLRALRSGAISYLVKPAALTSLRSVVETWLRAQPVATGALDRRELRQSEVNRLLRSRNQVATPRLPNRPTGIAPTTLESVMTALAQSPADLTARDVAARCGLSRASARRYLRYLVQTGALSERPRYGLAGRPEHLYRLAALDVAS